MYMEGSETGPNLHQGKSGVLAGTAQCEPGQCSMPLEFSLSQSYFIYSFI